MFLAPVSDDILHLPFHLHDAVFVDICRRVSRKVIGYECDISVLLLFRIDIGASIVAVGGATGFFDYFR